MYPSKTKLTVKMFSLSQFPNHHPLSHVNPNQNKQSPYTAAPSTVGHLFAPLKRAETQTFATPRTHTVQEPNSSRSYHNRSPPRANSVCISANTEREKERERSRTNLVVLLPTFYNTSPTFLQNIDRYRCRRRRGLR